MTDMTDADTKDEPEVLEPFQGIVFLSDLPDYAPGFAYVPNSHTTEFWANLKKEGLYDYMFKGRTTPPYRPMAKVDRTKPDPHKFCLMDYDGGKLKKLGAIAQGSYFIWAENSIHALVGSHPGKPGVIRHAQYLAYRPRTDPHCSGYGSYDAWIQDRIRSVTTGFGPWRYPSGETQHAFQPKRYDCYPSMAEAEHKKNGTPLGTRLRKSDRQAVPQLAVLDPKTVFGYVRPPLTQQPLYRFLIGETDNV
jgi:hypothetical protein